MNNKIFFVAFLFCFIYSLSNAQIISVYSANGGSVITELSSGIKVNKNSTLERTWLTLNDTTCPIQLNSSGVNTRYSSYNHTYKYDPAGSLLAKENITAFEIRFILYDVFCNHIKTLASTEVADVFANNSFPLLNTGSWRALENEVSELLTVVCFVAQVRTANGKIWWYNDKAISTELTKVRLKISSGVLDPTK